MSDQTPVNESNEPNGENNPNEPNAPENTPSAPDTYSLDRIVAYVANKKGISEDRCAKHVRARIRAYKSDLSKLDTTGNLARHNKGDSYQPFSAECARSIIRLALRANVANVVQESADVNALMAPAPVVVESNGSND